MKDADHVDTNQIEVAMAGAVRDLVGELNAIADQLLLAPYITVERQLIEVMTKLVGIKAAGDSLKSDNTDEARLYLFDAQMPSVEIVCEETGTIQP